MNEVLLTLANLELLRFCKDQGIDPGGSYVMKAGRGFIYNLVDAATDKAFVSVTFKKHNVPHFLCISKRAEAQQ